MCEINLGFRRSKTGKCGYVIDFLGEFERESGRIDEGNVTIFNGRGKYYVGEKRCSDTGDRYDLLKLEWSFYRNSISMDIVSFPI